MATTLFLYPNVIMLTPYSVLFFAIRKATRLADWVGLLVVILFIVCWGFRACFDAAFIHRSTLNAGPLLVAIAQSAVALVLVLELRLAGKRRAKAGRQERP
jgi:hypothetical protein